LVNFKIGMTEKRMDTNSDLQGLPDDRLVRLSALVDGELDTDEAGIACKDWRDSAESRSSWHAYHLIGDVLRSEDLASDPSSDLRFIEAFRSRLAQEPIVLALRPLQNSRVSSRSSVVRSLFGGGTWRVPSALAAGVVAVGGVLLVMRAPDSQQGEGQASVEVARAAPQAAPETGALATASLAASVPSVVEPEVFIANGKLIRDARLDRYLTAHKQFAGSSALGVPSAFLRNATADATDR
jgi:sigma-E factor negative regulatory protein RseA